MSQSRQRKPELDYWRKSLNRQQLKRRQLVVFPCQNLQREQQRDRQGRWQQLPHRMLLHPHATRVLLVSSARRCAASKSGVLAGPPSRAASVCAVSGGACAESLRQPRRIAEAPCRVWLSNQQDWVPGTIKQCMMPDRWAGASSLRPLFILR